MDFSTVISGPAGPEMDSSTVISGPAGPEMGFLAEMVEIFFLVLVCFFRSIERKNLQILKIE